MEEILDSTPTGITKSKHSLPNGLINKARTKDLFTSVSSTQYIMSDFQKKKSTQKVNNTLWRDEASVC